MRPTLSRLSATLAVIAAFGSASCRDLSETPFTEVTQANFNPTAADLAALLAPAYTPMRTIYMSWYGMVDFQEETADELLTPVRPNGWYDGGVYQRLHEHRWDANQGQPNGLYGNLYSGINAANRVIFQIESGVIPVDAATKASVIAELRGIRAHYYSVLLDNFGNVPIVTDFTSTELPAQSTRTSRGYAIGSRPSSSRTAVTSLSSRRSTVSSSSPCCGRPELHHVSSFVSSMRPTSAC